MCDARRVPLLLRGRGAERMSRCWSEQVRRWDTSGNTAHDGLQQQWPVECESKVREASGVVLSLSCKLVQRGRNLHTMSTH